MREKGAEFYKSKREEHLPDKNSILEEREKWERKYQEGYHEELIHPDRRVVEFLRDYGEELKEKRILDLGCGEGRNAREVARQGFEVWGIDISKTALEKAQQRALKENLKIHFTQGSFTHLPYQKECFGGIIANLTLHALKNWSQARKTFQEISRVLQENGLFFLHVKSRPKKGDLREKELKSDNSLLRGYYTEENIKSLAQESGLEIVEMKEQTSFDSEYEDETKGYWIIVFRKKQLSKER